MNRNYVIFNVTELNKIDWNQVMESSLTLRKSIDETRTIVEYIGNTMPASVSSLTSKQGPYNHQQIISIIAGPDWFQLDENETINDIL